MTTTTSTSAITTATGQLLNSLNTGSGVDTTTLVSSLMKAEFAARNDALATQGSTLTAQIGGVSTLKSAITSFATALQTLSTGGTLSTQPMSSNASAVTATALPGASLSGLSRSVTVTRLAAAQASRTADGHAFPSRTAATFTGTLTLSVGSRNADGSVSDAAPATLSLSQATSLDDVAKAINAANRGVSATIVTDAGGQAYLALKGQEGAAHAFTLTTDGDPSLADLAVAPGATGTTTTTAATDAALTVDGIAVTRPSNSISDLIDGVKLQLTGTSSTAVALTSSTPTPALSQAVHDFVDSYNQVLGTLTGLTDPKTGVLRADPAAQALLRSLRSLTTRGVLTGAATEPNGPTRLSDLGVGTQRDGTLKLDPAMLTRAVSGFPRSIEAMFALTPGSSNGLPAALNSISLAATSFTTGLGASNARYTTAQTGLTAAQDKLSAQSDAETARLTQQFAGMNAKVAAYKSTQTFLTNQVAAWNKSN